MDYKCRTEIPGFATAPDFFNDPISVEEEDEMFLDWFYDNVDDASTMSESVSAESLPYEQLARLAVALAEAKIGHDRTSTFKEVGGEVLDYLRGVWEAQS